MVIWLRIFALESHYGHRRDLLVRPRRLIISSRRPGSRPTPHQIPKTKRHWKGVLQKRHRRYQDRRRANWRREDGCKSSAESFYYVDRYIPDFLLNWGVATLLTLPCGVLSRSRSSGRPPLRSRTYEFRAGIRQTEDELDLVDTPASKESRLQSQATSALS